MSALSRALAEERWEVAAYLLLLGLARTLSHLSFEAVEEMLALREEDGREGEG